MSGKSNIQWTDATWNPTTGCTRVSPGCDHCYAFQLHDTRHVSWKRGRWATAPQQYHQPFSHVQLLPDRLNDPLHWRTPRRVFVDSMSDLFHEDVPLGYIAQVFEVMAKASRHTFQILTKRPERMQYFVDKYWSYGDEPVLPNVWLGTSVENQARADERIPQLMQTPAAVRFLSCEPLLGPVDLFPWLTFPGQHDKAEWCLAHYGRSQPLGWVIVGGESGPHARPMNLAWAHALVLQCQHAGVPVFVKQLGSIWAREGRKIDDYGRETSRHPHGGDTSEWPEDLRVREWPATVAESER